MCMCICVCVWMSQPDGYDFAYKFVLDGEEIPDLVSKHREYKGSLAYMRVFVRIVMHICRIYVHYACVCVSACVYPYVYMYVSMCVCNVCVGRRLW